MEFLVDRNCVQPEKGAAMKEQRGKNIKKNP